MFMYCDMQYYNILYWTPSWDGQNPFGAKRNTKVKKYMYQKHEFKFYDNINDVNLVIFPLHLNKDNR